MAANPFPYLELANTGLSFFNSIFAPSQQRRNMEYQQQLAMQNWRAQQEYNSPLNQRKRLMAAGINPNVAFAGTQTSAGSATAPPETAPFGSLTPAAAWTQEFTNNTASNIAALAAASKNKSDSKRIDDLLAGEIKKLSLENVSQDIQNQMNDFELRLKKLYGARKMSAETEKSVADYFSVLQEISNAAKTGQILDSQVYQASVDKLIKDLEKQGKDIEVNMLKERAKQLPALLTAEVNEVNSRSNANNASAENSRASAERTRTDTEFLQETKEVRAKLLQNQDAREVLENGEKATEVLSVLSDYDWNLEYLMQSERVLPWVKKFFGAYRMATRQATMPIKDLLKAVLK